MVALIDWDNLDDRERRQGARYVADKLWTTLGCLVPALLQGVQNFDVRLYGGWYGWNGARNITPLATQLAADVQNDFPFILRDSSGSQSVKISGELAHSLLRLPKQVLPHTFRQRQGSPRLSCGDPSKFGCTQPSCPMVVVHQFFSLRKCPESSCTRTIDQLLTRAEQKLVDTMLVADLIHLASSGETCLAVVSSDDDMWPGMLMAMSHGAHVVHVCTKHLSSRRLYEGAFQKQYTQGML
jgi:hypothetical protein